MMNLIAESTKNNAYQRAVTELNESLQRHNSHSVLLLCSGGSALSLVDAIDPKSLTDQITVTVLDERYSTDPKENNFDLLTQSSFYDHIQEAGCPVIDTRVRESESLDGLADRFNQALKQWVADNPDGIVVATFGIGADGHISGIMPFPESESLFDSQFIHTGRYAVGYDAVHKNPYRYRVTTTVSFLVEHITEAVVYVSDAERQSVVQQILDANKRLHQLPGVMLHDLARVSLVTSFPLNQ